MSLDVHLRGVPVGMLEPGSGTDYSFSYTPEIVAAAGEGTIVLSHSLPVREEAFGAIPTRTFFEGLLPESARRDEIARELRIDSNDTYRLLAEIGRDCAGAIVILPSEESLEPRGGSVEWIGDAELATMIEDLPKRPLGVKRQTGKMRLSLAGVQHKLTLIRSGSGAFGLPEADAPSTHLIKPQYDSEYPDLAYNELFCMRVATCLGLPVAETDLEEIGGRPCLISRRFDRSTDGAGTVRLHQEDLCQALGVPGNLKYERNLGPGYRRFRELLQEIGRAPDVQTMVRAAVLNFVLGNSDAHGKNYAILFAELGRQLAPLYDIVSTAVYDDLEEELAMAIGGNYEPESVRLADWMDMAVDCDLAPGRFLELVRGAAIDVRECAESVAAAAQAERWHRPVLDLIVEVAKRRSKRVESEIDPR